MAQIRPEVVEGTELAFAGRLIDVRKDTVRLPNGATSTREIVVHPDVIAVVPVLEDGRIVMVNQFRLATGRVLCEIPAGGIEPGETPEEAVCRELIEETGYRVRHLERLTGFYTSPGFTTEFMHLYLATGLEAGQATEEIDEIEVLAVSLDEALDRWRSGEIADAKTIVGLVLYQQRTRVTL